VTAPKVAELPIDEVEPNPRHDTGDVSELAASIRQLIVQMEAS
jgi:hypothetical protein